MAVKEYRHLTSSTLLASEVVTSEEALALASMPGACEGNRYRVFVETDQPFAKGSFARIEFILPGKPGRWSAAGEVTCEVKAAVAGVPQGVCMELLGLTLAGTTAPAAEEATTSVAAVESSAAVAEPQVAFDPSEMEMDDEDVCSMLADLMGRDVDSNSVCGLPGELADNAIVSVFRDDDGAAVFTIVFDKAGAARVGGALTMLPEAAMNDDAKSKEMLKGEPLENVSEVLNIMSALFHEAGTPHVVLAEIMNGEDMRDFKDGELVSLFDKPRWSLSHGLEIEDYGKGEVYIAAV